MFEHRKMSQAALRFKGSNPTPVETDLKKVIELFAQLQEDRYTADYDVGKHWSRSDVRNALGIADEAFKAWRTIREEKIAQGRLLTMFGARRM